MEKNKLSSYFVALSVLTFLAIFIFLVQQSYGNLIRATITVQKDPIIKPIDPNLPIDVLPTIEQRQEYLP